MFKITPVQSYEEQMKIAEMCGAEAMPGFFSYAMRDAQTGELMGFSQFEIGEVGFISHLLPAKGYEDFEAMFILGRATMNFIDQCGTHTAKASDSGADSRLLHAIGFRLDENQIYVCDMSGMFDGHCSGEAVKL